MSDLVGKVPPLNNDDDNNTNTEVITNTNACGLDIGTMNLVSAFTDNQSNITTKSMRNVFLHLDRDNIGSLDISGLSHAIIDGELYILSQHAFDLANMFGRTVSRPMKDGMISSSEIDAMDVISAIIRNLIGVCERGNLSNCVYSIPANPIDTDDNVTFHEKLFGRIINSLGYKATPLNEATAIVYSEAADTNFSAVGISFGAGMTNIAVVFRSIPVITFSVGRGGDWIDNQVSKWTNSVPNRITRIKEQELDLSDLDYNSEKNKKKRNIKRALNQYYRSLISYSFENIINQLKDLDVDLPEELPMIISGGTSKAKGFIEVTGELVKDYEFPFDISEVRSAEDPLTAVAQGCLVKALKL